MSAVTAVEAAEIVTRFAHLLDVFDELHDEAEAVLRAAGELEGVDKLLQASELLGSVNALLEDAEVDLKVGAS